MIAAPKFSAEDLDNAWREWGCNCGPTAIAAITGLTLDQVRPHLSDFGRKRYTNPTMMNAALVSLGREFTARALGRRGDIAGWQNSDWPVHGLARVQWEGPWTKPGVPMMARYRCTHWVASARRADGEDLGVFDCNAVGNGTGWVSFEDWRHEIVPWILRELVPGATGGWHLTHSIEVKPT